MSEDRRYGLNVDRGTFLAYAAALAVVGCGASSREPHPPLPSPAAAPSASVPDAAAPSMGDTAAADTEPPAPSVSDPESGPEPIPVPAGAGPALADVQAWRMTCRTQLTPSCEWSERVLPLCVGLNELILHEVGDAAMRCAKDLDDPCGNRIVEACVAPLAVKWAAKLAGREVSRCEALHAIIPGAEPWGMGSCTQLFARTLRKYPALQNIDGDEDD